MGKGYKKLSLNRNQITDIIVAATDSPANLHGVQVVVRSFVLNKSIVQTESNSLHVCGSYRATGKEVNVEIKYYDELLTANIVKLVCH